MKILYLFGLFAYLNSIDDRYCDINLSRYIYLESVLYSLTIEQIEFQVYNDDCEKDHRWHCLSNANLILHSNILHLGNRISCNDLISLQEAGNFAKLMTTIIFLLIMCSWFYQHS